MRSGARIRTVRASGSQLPQQRYRATADPQLPWKFCSSKTTVASALVGYGDVFPMGTGAWKDSSICRRKPGSISLRNGRVPQLTTDSGAARALRDTFLAEHAHLVRHIAHHLFRRPTYIDVADLIEAGMVGLSDAMSGQARHNAKDFDAYATTLIRAAMLEFVRKSNWSARPR
jgi:hypothetical protein